MSANNTYDFIVIGSGPGGGVLSTRLTENESVSVLLIEAGGSKIPEASSSPFRWNEMLLGEYDWAYFSEEQEFLDNRRVYSAAGKMPGGTSGIYHMIHTRGKREDYDNWAYNGCNGWSYNEVLPYLQKLENQVDDTNPECGKGGPINVINAKNEGNPISKSFLEACSDLGYPIVEDFNDATKLGNNMGAGWHHVNIKDGERWGVYKGYLEKSLLRNNLTFSTDSFVTKLIIEEKKCTGVEYIKDGKTCKAFATKEVILSAGAIQSPKLLMLSGIGDPDLLKSNDIPVICDLPGVGKNFHDHPLIIGPMILLNDPGIDPKGNMTEVALFWKSFEEMTCPDMEITMVHRAPFGENFFDNVSKRAETGLPVNDVTELVNPRVILTLPGLMRPLSRGTVSLKNSDPNEPPLIDCNYFSEEIDLERMVKMIHIGRSIYKTPTMKKLGAIEIGPGENIQSEEDLRQWVKTNVGSYYHFVGSCKMGIDNMSVVDTSLRVKGISQLRVVDASVMPTITAANTHTTTVMIGEKAAHLIKTNYGI